MIDEKLIGDIEEIRRELRTVENVEDLELGSIRKLRRCHDILEGIRRRHEDSMSRVIVESAVEGCRGCAKCNIFGMCLENHTIVQGHKCAARVEL